MAWWTPKPSGRRWKWRRPGKKGAARRRLYERAREGDFWVGEEFAVDCLDGWFGEEYPA